MSEEQFFFGGSSSSTQKSFFVVPDFGASIDVRIPGSDIKTSPTPPVSKLGEIKTALTKEQIKEAYQVMCKYPCAICGEEIDIDTLLEQTDFNILSVCKCAYHLKCLPDDDDEKKFECGNCVCMVCDKNGPDVFGGYPVKLTNCSCTYHKKCYALLTNRLDMRALVGITQDYTRCIKCVPSGCIDMTEDPLIMGKKYMNGNGRRELLRFRDGFAYDDVEGLWASDSSWSDKRSNHIGELRDKPTVVISVSEPLVVALYPAIEKMSVTPPPQQKKKKKWGPPVLVPQTVPQKKITEDSPELAEITPMPPPPKLGDRLYYSHLTLLQLVNEGFTLRDITRHLGRTRFLERFFDIIVITKCLMKTWISVKDGCSGPTFVKAWKKPLTVRDVMMGYKGSLNRPLKKEEIFNRSEASLVTPMDLAVLGFSAVKREEGKSEEDIDKSDLLEAGLTIDLILGISHPELWRANFEDLDVKKLPGWFNRAKELRDLELVTDEDLELELAKGTKTNFSQFFNPVHSQPQQMTTQAPMFYPQPPQPQIQHTTQHVFAPVIVIPQGNGSSGFLNPQRNIPQISIGLPRYPAPGSFNGTFSIDLSHKNTY